MAAASASSFSPVLAAACTIRTRTRTQKVNYIAGLNSFGGLKANNSSVISLGLPLSTEQSFERIVSSLRNPLKGRSHGGAMAAKCNAASEIFRIAAIMNGLVLVGVAVGFVLLRIEASLEEAAD